MVVDGIYPDRESTTQQLTVFQMKIADVLRIFSYTSTILAVGNYLVVAADREQIINASKRELAEEDWNM